MANGDILTKSASVALAPKGIGYKLLDAAAVVVDGPWVDVRALQPGSIEVFGTFVGTVQFQACNQDAPPLVTYQGAVLGSLTAPGLFTMPARVRYVRARLTAWTSGSASAFFHSTN